MPEFQILELINQWLYQKTNFNRTEAHAQTVLDNGAKWADKPAELTKQVDVLFTMVGFPQDVENIYF